MAGPPPPGKRPYDGPVSGEIRGLFAFIGTWAGVSVAVAAVFYWLRPHIPTRRMVVVVRSGRRRRVVAVAGRIRVTPDRVVAEIDPDSRIILLPRRRVATADPRMPMVIGGRLHYDISEPGKAAGAGEPIAVALGEGIISAVDEYLRDMPMGRAIRSRDEIGQRLIKSLAAMRAYGIAVTDVELVTFTGPDGQAWGPPPAQPV